MTFITGLLAAALSTILGHYHYDVAAHLAAAAGYLITLMTMVVALVAACSVITVPALIVGLVVIAVCEILMLVEVNDAGQAAGTPKGPDD